MTPQEIIKQQAAQQREQVVQTIIKQIEGVVASGYTVEEWAKIAINVFATNPKLVTCSTVSLIRAFADAMESGLRPNSKEGYCYIIPYNGEATFVMGYYGLLELAYRTGQVRDLRVQLVYSNDEYNSETKANEVIINHKYNSMLPVAERGKLVGGYAILRTTRGGIYTTELSHQELEQRRLKSPAAELEVWRSNWQEMYKKTLLRNLVKYVRKQWEDRSSYSERNSELALAERVDSGTDEFVTGGAVSELRSVSEEPNGGTSGPAGVPVGVVGVGGGEDSARTSGAIAEEHAKDTNALPVAGANSAVSVGIGNKVRGSAK